MKSQNAVFKAHLVALCLIIVAAFLLTAQPILAQTNFQGGLNFIAGFPQGEFKDNVDENGFGIAGEFLYSPSTSPLGIGVSLGYMNYGQEAVGKNLVSISPRLKWRYPRPITSPWDICFYAHKAKQDPYDHIWRAWSDLTTFSLRPK